MAATYVTVTNASSNQLSLVGDNGGNRIDIPATAGSNTATINMSDLLGDNLLCTTLSTWITAGTVTITRGSTTLTAANLTAYAQGSDMNRSDYDSDDDEVVDTAEALKIVNPTSIVAGASPYTVLATDTVLLVDTAAGAVEVDLPAVASNAGRTIVVKDEGGNSATNAITIDPNASETLDGSATSATINTAYGYMTLFCDGTQWLSNSNTRAHEASVQVATRSVGIADLTAAAGHQSFDFAAALPADAVVVGAYVDVTEAFTDGAAGTFTVDLGVSGGTTDALVNGGDITTAIAKIGTPAGGAPRGWYGGTTFAVDVIGTVNVDTATAGALTAKIAYIRVDFAIAP